MRLEYIDWGIFALSAMLLLILLFFVKRDDNSLNEVTLFWIGIIIAMNILIPYLAAKNTTTNIQLFNQNKTLVKFATKRGQSDYIISKKRGWEIKNDIYFVNDVFIVKASKCDLLEDN